MADDLRINGNLHGWGSLRLLANGEIFTGFTSISFADKRERTMAYGMGRHHAPRGRSPGKYSTENPKLGGPPSSMAALRAGLAQLAPDRRSYGNVLFDVVLQYIELDQTPMHVVLQRCHYVGSSSSHEESADPLKEEAELSCMYILRNGLTLFDSTKGMP